MGEGATNLIWFRNNEQILLVFDLVFCAFFWAKIKIFFSRSKQLIIIVCVVQVYFVILHAYN